MKASGGLPWGTASPRHFPLLLSLSMPGFTLEGEAELRGDFWFACFSSWVEWHPITCQGCKAGGDGANPAIWLLPTSLCNTPGLPNSIYFSLYLAVGWLG